jgi:hypothetical protein
MAWQKRKETKIIKLPVGDTYFLLHDVICKIF